MITTIMTIDESCAFDSVRHNILLEKMDLYNFSEQTIEWFQDYLRFRTQYVVVNTKPSRMTAISHGVPQGSVLGPVLYTLFINEMPELTKDYENCKRSEHNNTEKLFGLNCLCCGTVPSFADDATVVHSSNCQANKPSKT